MPHHTRRRWMILRPVEIFRIQNIVCAIQRASVDINDAQALAERLRPDRILRDLEFNAIGSGPTWGSNWQFERFKQHRKYGS